MLGMLLDALRVVFRVVAARLRRGPLRCS